MNIKYIDARFNGEIKLSNEVLEYLKKHRVENLVVFASVQFLNLDLVKEQLKDAGVEFSLVKAKRCSEEGQVLGCDCYGDSFSEDLSNFDLVLYIGDGSFHPTSLLFSQLHNQMVKPIVSFNPISNKMNILELEDVREKTTKMKVNIKKFVAAEKIGIFVSSKSGQHYYNLAVKLKEKLLDEGKKAFIFVGDNFSFEELENFNFVEVWVNSACPRIVFDDSLNASRPVVNIKDGFEPLKALDRL